MGKFKYSMQNILDIKIKLETQANINSFEKISKIIDEIGMDRIAEVVSKRDGVEAQCLVLDMLK